MAYPNNAEKPTEIGPIAARGGVIGNGVIYVLAIGAVLAVVGMVLAVMLFT
jgi:hypothetical protein